MAPPRDPKTILVQVGNEYRYFLETECGRCGIPLRRRSDQVANWSGLCRKCSTKVVAMRPESRELSRRNGLAFVAANGAKFLRNCVNPKNLRRGPRNAQWRGGITAEYLRARASVAAKEWRKAIFFRDRFACQCCLKTGGDLEADHILPFAIFPEIRFLTENGRTVCKPCHRQFGARVSRGEILRPAFSPLSRG